MKTILITGAAGYLGAQLGNRLSASGYAVLGIDKHLIDTDFPLLQMDIRSSALADLMREHEVDRIVHLASIVNPGQNEVLEYDIDVNGTENILRAALAAHVTHITLVSSGAAYGYHADNPAWLTETDALRGNDEFSYSRNKRLVEECLAEYRIHSPALKQLILRPGTILGASTDNMITQLLCRKRLLAIRHSTSPFVFIWDQDMLAILEEGVVFAKEGCFNVAGDGALTIAELAKLTGRSTLTLPAWLLKALLWLGNRFGITAAGPHHLLFLRYRPVLLNTALKNQFGYIPVKSSKATFMYFWQAYQARQRA